MIRSIRGPWAEASTGSPSQRSIYTGRRACRPASTTADSARTLTSAFDSLAIDTMNLRKPARTTPVTPSRTRIPRFRLVRTVSSAADALKHTGQFINPKSQVPNPRPKSQQVQDDEHQDPDHVDEIPVKRRGFDATEKPRRVMPVHDHARATEKPVDEHAAGHVHGMKKRHHEIETDEITRGWSEAFRKLAPIFDRLDCKKDDAERCGRHHERAKPRDVSTAQRGDSTQNRHTRGDEHHRIHRGQRYVHDGRLIWPRNGAASQQGVGREQ